MVTRIHGYYTPADYAKIYTTPRGRTGVSRQYILKLIAKEISTPGVTGIDVLEIGGTYLIKPSQPTEPAQEQAL